MSEAREPRFDRKRKLLLGGVLGAIVIAVLGVVIGSSLMKDKDDDPTKATSIPINTRSASGATNGSGVSVVSSLVDDQEKGRLQIRLSMGQEEPDESQSLSLVTGEPLTEEEVQLILDRLPTLEVDPDDIEDFKLPDEILPPPRPGETVEETFPPLPEDIRPVDVVSGPLEVLRFSPEGEIPLAPFLNVMFNQPMIPLATIEQLMTEDVPVLITPEIPGTWLWLGTKTLNFEYQSDEFDRFPMATQFVAQIPAGTESATGGVLAESVSWQFSTPPPKVISSYPHRGPHVLEPLIFVAFDQIIDPEAVLSTIRATADGNQVALRLATLEEVEEDATVSRMAKRSGDNRWLAFRASQPLPADASIQVIIGPGTPSQEGPLVTQQEQSFDFFTYPPLKISDHGCSWYRDECPPLTPFFIRFNNPIDTDVFDPSMVLIDPEIPGAIVEAAGSNISIRGATKGRTDYEITVSGAIQDIFGQVLGRDRDRRIEVGTARPYVSGPNQMLTTLDPSSSEPVLSIYSINYGRLELRVYEVQPDQWTEYREFRDDLYRSDRVPEPPGRKVFDERIRIEAEDDELIETSIDLSEELDGDYGHLIVVVEPPSNARLEDYERRNQTLITWVQVTQIGLDAFIDHSEMVIWASSLQNGAPLSNVKVQLAPRNNEVSTGSDGTVRVDLADRGVNVLIASQGDDTAILPSGRAYWDDSTWSSRTPADELRWYVFDDRQMYRPGEEVHIKGWMRRIGGSQNGDVSLIGDIATSVNYEVVGPQGNQFDQGSLRVNALGGFDLKFTLPENANLGRAYISLELRGSTGALGNTRFHHSLNVQEFRRPEFEVKARNETTGPYFVGDHAVVAVSANYFAGGPLPNADVAWAVDSSPSSYSPPNWSEFVFGTWRPWWFYYEPVDYYEEEYYGFSEGGISEDSFNTFAGLTDAAGNHYLRLDFEEATEPRPFSVFAVASVMDVNRQAWGAATTLLVHPAELYVGLRSERTFVQKGTPLEIQAIVTDLDGTPISGKSIKVRASRLVWRYVDGSWREVEEEAQECILDSTLEPVTCIFDTEQGGTYQIAASITDDQGRMNKSQFTRWVSGGKRPTSREVEQESATLIPNKETFQPGDVAEILVQSPFSPAEGLLTVSRSGLLYTERFSMPEGSYTIRVPIEDAHIPNLQIQVDLVGEAPRTDEVGEAIEGVPPRPAYARGNLTIDIPPFSRTLDLRITPRETKVEPGGETVIDVLLTNVSGRPVHDAELAVVVVDEAILALTNYQLADPIATFYLSRPSLVSSAYGRESIILANPEILLEQSGADGLAGAPAPMATMNVQEESEMVFESAMEEPAMAADMAGESRGAEEGVAIRVRSDFNPLATFAPAVHTDSDGRAQVNVRVPDNLTRYRVMVVAVSGGNQFGSGESNLTARLPLMVRPSAPRFLNFGDQFELPVVVQNQTDEPMTVDVVVEVGNIELTAGAGQRVSVPANDRVEVRFPASTARVGTGRFQIAAVSGSYADAATVELPIYTPATTEAFATYGVIDDGAVAQPVAAPAGVFPQFGGLEITTSSTALQALTDAVLYLHSYRYECSEQLASRILAVAALRDVLDAFSAAGLPPPEEIEAAVLRDIDSLKGMQNYDGGFPSWVRGRDSIPFNTIHVAHALQIAKEEGFPVPPDTQQSVLEYLRDIENHFPHWYGLRTRQTMSAYALYVRTLMGDRDTTKAGRLLQEAGLDNLSLEAVAWLWQVLANDRSFSGDVETIKQYISNRAVETAAAANFTTSYGDQAYLMLHSNRRTDGILLDALIEHQSDSDLIPKVVNGLLAHRTAGRWRNTQENVFILLALNNYFNTFEAVTPDFVARIWLGDIYAGGHEFIGRTTERHETDIPMAYLFDVLPEDGETGDLVVSKEGDGRLYYRLGLSYAPADLKLESLDMGFVVQRSYEGVDDPEDVYRDEDGVWHFKAGARVRVRLTMVTNNRRYHVALVDPLPAGLEIINPALAVSGDIPQDPADSGIRYGWWWRTWYEHQNMRDERAEAFTTLLWDGVYNYTYVARATTPGHFVVPPAKAEEMYSPEVFGRSASDWVIVE